MNISALYLIIIFIPFICLASSSLINKHETTLKHVISDYRISLASMPLDYSLLEIKQLPGITLQRYNLNSQMWSPQGVVYPKQWQNEVDIYIPNLAKAKNALVVINNGSNNNGSGSSIKPTNFSDEILSRIAVATQTVVISISNIPNQPLNYQGIKEFLDEDDSIAYSWKLFTEDIDKYKNASLYIPMAASVSQAIRLAKKELIPQNITKFMVTGVSKRGWAAWLTALSDPNIDAIIPFVIDLLNTKKSLKHMYLSYGKNWPIAFYPYYKQGIDKQIDTDSFTSLMTLEDPLVYLNTDMGNRLNIAKYIINASGDDFYVPDNSHFYYDQLPGPKSIRVVPNSTHNGILSVVEQSLITFVNRFQGKQNLPEIIEKVKNGEDDKKELMVSFSEKPLTVLLWTAKNPTARDFRYACGIKYNSTPINLVDGQLNIPLSTPNIGWQATYIEAIFKDGYVATTQVYITPNEKFPETAPPSIGANCQTIPGRGLG